MIIHFALLGLMLGVVYFH